LTLAKKKNTPKLDLIVSEAALRRPMGGREVTTQQLRVLLETAQQPDVRLRIVPFAVSGDAGLHTAFSVMEFRRQKSVVAVVYVQHPTTGLFLEQQDKVDAYRRRVARLARFALGPAESMNLLASITREFELARDTNDDAGTDTHHGSKVGNPARGDVLSTPGARSAKAVAVRVR
jgi:hypothetical protein